MARRLQIVDADALTLADLEPAVAWLRQGRIVAFPTETFYGLAVDPASGAAVEALFDLKGRRPQLAIPLIAASVPQVEAACGPLGPISARLAAAWWPGPLSLICDAPIGIHDAIHGGRRSIAIRVPAHPVARALAGALGTIVTATSANVSGAPPAASPRALERLAADARVFVIDSGETPGGAPSTIVDARGSRVELVREGAVPWNRVLESLER
jgi:L-threonylcarbamoyladenylate synthase